MFDFTDDFNKYKDEILEVLISHYGEDKRELITKRFNLIAFDFSSLPTDDYEYALKHSNELSYEDLLLIEEEYIKFKNISLELKQKFINQFSKHLLDEEQLENFTLEDRDLFISLFTDENFKIGLKIYI